MKKRWIILLGAALTMASGVYVRADASDDGIPGGGPADSQEYAGEKTVHSEGNELWSEAQKILAGILNIGGEEETEGQPVEIDPGYKGPEIITSGDYQYWINDDRETVTIAKYTGDEDEIVIPSEIDGYRVSDIGYQAFTYQKMKSLSFPESICSIGQRAFEYCSITDGLLFPENVTISDDAFSYAKLPPVLIIPAGATTQKCAFSYCNTIEQVFIGPGAVIQGRTFGYCEKMNLVVCAGGSRLKTNGFEYCKALGKVIFCGNVEKEEKAFCDCGNFEVTEEEESVFDIFLQTDMNDLSDPKTSSDPAGDEKEITLEIQNSPASQSGVVVTLENASAAENARGFNYSISGTIENTSDEGIMQVIYTVALIDMNGEEFRSFGLVYDGGDTAIPPHTKIRFSHDDIKWGRQSVPAAVSIGIGTVKTETELPPVHIPEAGEYLYQALGDEKLANIIEKPPVELSFHVDQGGYGRTATFKNGEALDRAVKLFCNIKIGDEANEWVTDNYNWIGLTWEDGTSTFISLNLANLEYNIHSSPHTYLLKNLNEFWSYAADYLEEEK